MQFEVKKKESKSLAEEVRKTDSTGVKGSFMYTSAHERDLKQIKELCRELASINMSGVDERNPDNEDLIGWTDVEYLFDDCDEDIDISLDYKVSDFNKRRF